MDFDHLAEQRSGLIFRVWMQNLLQNAPEELSGKLAAEHHPGQLVTASRFGNGAFNFCYRVTYQDGTRVLVRYTALGRVLFRNEKVEDEVAAMKYLAQETSVCIPVPTVLGSGKCAVGPYIVMTVMEGSLMSDYLKDPTQEGSVLNENLPVPVLKKAYSRMARVMLELSKPEFPSIGAVRQDESGVWTVQKRPLTFNMNRLAQFSNLPPDIFTKQVFTNAGDYFYELAQHHFYHLEHQLNDAVADAADCRRKYIARCLFRKISRDIPQDEHRNGPFRLFCDDLHPGNVLIDTSQPDELRVSGVIDWEFTYAAPVEFTYTAPWWLLLERPEDWDADLNHFLPRYMPKLRIFLEALRECEDRMINEGSLAGSQRLSDPMDKSLENGLFWTCLAARHSAMFDEIYWTFIDERYYGPFSSIEERMSRLSEEERRDIDAFVDRKLQQADEGRLESYLSVQEMVEL